MLSLLEYFPPGPVWVYHFKYPPWPGCDQIEYFSQGQAFPSLRIRKMLLGVTFTRLLLDLVAEAPARREAAFIRAEGTPYSRAVGVFRLCVAGR